MITGLNYIPLKFYVCIEHLLEVRVTVRVLQIALILDWWQLLPAGITEVCTVYGDRIVCSCRHSKSSAWV